MKTLLTLALLLTVGTAQVATAEHLTADIPSSDGVLIHAESWGSGPATLVLVHGWSCDATYWAGQIDDLAKDYRVVTIDLAGHGQSGSGREVYTIEAFGQDVAAVLAHWNLRHVIIVGHSMGGAVMVEAALAAPDRMLGLIGVDDFQQVNIRLTSEQVAGFIGTFERNFADFTAQWVRSMFPAGADSALVADISGDMAAAPPTVALSAMSEVLHWYGDKAKARLTQVKVPLMCINADMQPTDEAAMRAVVPAYQVRYMPNSGHFLFREDPATFNRLLREVIGEIMPK